MALVVDKKINLMCPVTTTGYGVVGYNTALHMHSQGWKVNLLPTGGLRNDGYLNLFKSFCQYGAMFDHDAPCLNIWHQFDLAKRVGRGRYVAWPIFELNKFNDLEKHHLAYPDSLVVCSEWAKKVIQDEGIKQEIDVVPLGVDTNIFAYYKIKRDWENTVFFHAGKWEVRKGHDFMVEWFNDAFDVDDKVELKLMPHNPFLSQEEASNWINMYMSSKMGKAGKITIVPWKRTQHEVADVMRHADCGLFPARAEGWNLELLEMLALGKPVITTNYSAHTEFCNQDNALLIECNNLEMAFDGKWFHGDIGYWASIEEEEKEQAIYHMRTVHKAVQEGANTLNTAGIQTATKFSWSNTVRLLENAIYKNNSAS